MCVITWKVGGHTSWHMWTSDPVMSQKQQTQCLASSCAQNLPGESVIGITTLNSGRPQLTIMSTTTRGIVWECRVKYPSSTVVAILKPVTLDSRTYQVSV